MSEKDGQRPQVHVIGTGMFAALIGAASSVLLGIVLIVVFGLAAFAYDVAGTIVVVGMALLVPNVLGFFPCASLVAIVFCGIRLRHTSRRTIVYACTTAVVLLFAFSVATTGLLYTYGSYLDQKQTESTLEYERIQQSLLKVADVSAEIRDDAIHIEPTLVGDLPGTYTVNVRVKYRVPLYSESWEIQVPLTDTSVMSTVVPLDVIRDAFRTHHVRGNEPVMVEGTFTIVYSVHHATHDAVFGTSKQSTKLKIDLGKF